MGAGYGWRMQIEDLHLEPVAIQKMNFATHGAHQRNGGGEIPDFHLVVDAAIENARRDVAEMESSHYRGR